MKILIAYASRYGSTKSIADRIRSRIEASNVGDVTVDAVTNIVHLSDFDILIVGSCIHMGSWIGDGSNFIQDNHGYMRQHSMPVWAFSVGMPPKKEEKGEEVKIEKWLKKKVDIQGHKLFQGCYKMADMPWFWRLFFGCFRFKSEDRRDWDAIDGWTDLIVQDLRTRASGTSRG